ncbi:MAG: glycosyltransferase family 4 protein [Planctomycetes bacterium]|nr:glycosyltransferase family 4 protein [Planctomycetota bacterium]
MKKLSILHLNSARQYVGEAARVADLAQCQIEKGHRAAVVVRDRHPLAEELTHRNINHINARMNSKFRPISDYRDMRLIRKALDELEVDVIHAHRGKDHWLALMALWGYKRKITLVRTRHVVMPIKDHYANRRLYENHTDGVICVSRAVEKEVLKSLHFYSGPVRVIKGGVRPERLNTANEDDAQAMRRRLHIPENAPVLTMLARLAKVKGQVHAVEALPLILKEFPDAVMIFAYPRQSNYRAKIEEAIDHFKVKPHIRWLGRLDNISILLKMSSMGLVTSVGSEGWSRTTVENMHMGLPMVATSVGSIPEIIVEGETGFVVPPENPRAFAGAVCKILGTEGLAEKMSQAARKEAQYYTCQRMTDDVLEFYNELIDRKNNAKA